MLFLFTDKKFSKASKHTRIKRVMAYAAITSLMSTIKQSMECTGLTLQIFYENLESLRATLEKSCSSITGDLEALTSLEAKIIELACGIELMVDSESRKVSLTESAVTQRIDFWELRFALKQAVGHIDSEMNQWMVMQSKSLETENMSAFQHDLEYENMMVGLENEFEMTQDQLARGASELEVVSIVGMGGIGKATLANKIYNDPFIMSHFDVHAKATVSQDCYVRNVILGLLSSISGKTHEFYKQDDGKVADQLQKLLKGRRYLIVIDDIWTSRAWDDIKLSFSDWNNGSRILMTTRNRTVAEIC